MASYHRLMMGAGLRRVGVYAMAALLTIIVGLIAASLARPGDFPGRVRVEGAARSGAATRSVGWDGEQGRAVVDVEEGDGTVRRYYMQKTDDERTRVWGGDAVEAKQSTGE